MMVEPHKLELIVTTIQDQAALLRRAGCLSQALGMEKRATELRSLIIPTNGNKLVGIERQAA